MDLTIGTDGTTPGVEVRMSALNNQAIEQCLVTAISGGQFPRPEEDAVVRIALDLQVHALHDDSAETSGGEAPAEEEVAESEEEEEALGRSSIRRPGCTVAARGGCPEWRSADAQRFPWIPA